MVESWLLATQFVVAGLMLVLAAWLAWLDIRSPPVRLLAAFLVVRAGTILLEAVGSTQSSPLALPYFDAIVYYQISAIALVIGFACVFPRRSVIATRAGIIGLVASTLAVLVVYSLDHCTVMCVEGSIVRAGPLGILVAGSSLCTAIAAAIFARSASREPSAHRRITIQIIAAGFLITSAVDAGVFIAAALRDGPALLGAYAPSIWRWGMVFAPIATLVPAWIAARILWNGPDRRAAIRILSWASASFATGLLIGFVPWAVSKSFAPAFLSLWRLALPILVAYGLLRFRLFGLDTKTTITLSRGTVGGAFLVVFFVVSGLAENYVSDQVSSYFGVAAAVLLIILLAPLQHMAERLIHRTIGKPQPVQELPFEDRAEVYRRAARRARKHGAISPRQRVALDELRQAVALTQAEVEAIEFESQASQSTHVRENEPHES